MKERFSQWLLKTDLIATFSSEGPLTIDFKMFEAYCQGKDRFIFALLVSPVLKKLSLATNGTSASNPDLNYIQNAHVHFTK